MFLVRSHVDEVGCKRYFLENTKNLFSYGARVNLADYFKEWNSDEIYEFETKKSAEAWRDCQNKTQLKYDMERFGCEDEYAFNDYWYKTSKEIRMKKRAEEDKERAEKERERAEKERAENEKH